MHEKWRNTVTLLKPFDFQVQFIFFRAFCRILGIPGNALSLPIINYFPLLDVERILPQL